VGGLVQVNHTTFLQVVPVTQGGTKTAFFKVYNSCIWWHVERWSIYQNI